MFDMDMAVMGVRCFSVFCALQLLLHNGRKVMTGSADARGELWSSPAPQKSF
jgi:hypothetical protein